MRHKLPAHLKEGSVCSMRSHIALTHSSASRAAMDSYTCGGRRGGIVHSALFGGVPLGPR